MNGIGLITPIIAVVPAIILVFMIYRQDKIEREPFGLLFKLFVFGALSIIFALLCEEFGTGFAENFFDDRYSESFYLFDTFIVVALSEEAGKYLAFKLAVRKRREFNYTFDAMVYAACVGIGFAVPENVLYVMDGGLSTALLRMLTSIPGHVSFAVFMGYYLGFARESQAKGDERSFRRNKIKALWVPVLLHGFYDYLLTTELDFAVLVFILYIIVLDILAIRLVRKAAREDREIALSRHICVNSNEFVIVATLGSGSDGASYVVSDLSDRGRWVVKEYYRNLPLERTAMEKMNQDVESYNTLCGLGIRMPQLYDVDAVRTTIAKELIGGPTLAQIMQSGGPAPALVQQVRAMADAARMRGLNLSYEPEDYVVRDGLVYYVDYQTTPYNSRNGFENSVFGRMIAN